MDSVQSLTDEVTLLRKENVALTRENTVSRINNTPFLLRYACSLELGVITNL
jgi:hypothetical protein